MPSRPRRYRALAPALLSFALVSGAAGVAAAADQREACATAAERAQSLRDDGKYRQAREQMLVCARDVCPGPIRSDCTKWLEDVQRDAPTLVFGAREGSKDLVDVKVSVDGTLVATSLDGKAFLVDAGAHTVKFERGSDVREERLVVRAGEKGRAVSVDFGKGEETSAQGSGSTPTTEPPAVEKSGGSLTPALVVGGVGIAALGVGAVFGVMGLGEYDDLGKCKPHCTNDAVDGARTKLLIADVGVGVGVVALAVSAVMILTRPKAQELTDAQAKRSPSGVRFDLAPSSAGVSAGLSGSF